MAISGTLIDLQVRMSAYQINGWGSTLISYKTLPQAFNTESMANTLGLQTFNYVLAPSSAGLNGRVVLLSDPSSMSQTVSGVALDG